MPLYNYKSIDSKGHKKSGVIDAPSLQKAKEKLRSQGIFIVSLSDQRSSNKIFKKSKTDLSSDHRLNFTTQLSQLINAGIPLYESLLSLEEQYRQEPFHPTIASLCEQVKGGSSLSLAMKNYPQSFDQLYCALIAAGESVGALDQTLERLVQLLSKQIKLRKQILTAMIYPAVLGCFSLLIIFLLLTFAIPSIEAIFAEREVNGFTRFVINVSHVLTHYWVIYLPLLFALGYAAMLFLRSQMGRLWKNRLFLKLPLIKTLTIQTALSRFARTMGTLQKGGVPIIDALQISRKVMRNPILEEIIENAEKKIVEGSTLGQELKKAPHIPSLVFRMLSIGEESGDTAHMLNKIADLYEEDLEKNLTRLTALAQPLILLVMGAIVGVIMMAVLLPLTDISSFTNG